MSEITVNLRHMISDATGKEGLPLPISDETRLALNDVIEVLENILSVPSGRSYEISKRIVGLRAELKRIVKVDHG